MKDGLKWNNRILVDSSNNVYAAVVGYGSEVKLIVYRDKRLVDLGNFSSVESAKQYAEKAI